MPESAYHDGKLEAKLLERILPLLLTAAWGLTCKLVAGKGHHLKALQRQCISLQCLLRHMQAYKDAVLGTVPTPSSAGTA